MDSKDQFGLTEGINNNLLNCNIKRRGQDVYGFIFLLIGAEFRR